MENTNARSGGVGFAGALTILFIALKLTGKISWPWWKVLAPIWVTIIFIAVLIVVYIALSIVSKK